MSRDHLPTHEHGTALLSDLKGAVYNPRVMPDREMKNLMKSLREFGFVQPVVVRRDDGLILGGHQRCEARKRIASEDKEDEAGITVPVVWVAGISDEKAKLLNVALNRIHGEWDYAKLGELFESLQPMVEQAQLEVSGFSDKEIDDIIKLTSANASTDLGGDDDDLDVDAELAAEARKFGFEVGTDADAALVREALTAHGMTSPANAGSALAKMARAALTHVKCEEDLCE
jgi:ParB-like chromosome segregation protein Spo0J